MGNSLVMQNNKLHLRKIRCFCLLDRPLSKALLDKMRLWGAVGIQLSEQNLFWEESFYLANALFCLKQKYSDASKLSMVSGGCAADFARWWFSTKKIRGFLESRASERLLRVLATS